MDKRTIMERIRHWPSTATGLALGGLIVYAMKSMGCELPTDWMTWGLGLLTAAPSLLAKG
jgi:hypothetical protein